jgi:hypothetical protein
MYHVQYCIVSSVLILLKCSQYYQGKKVSIETRIRNSAPAAALLCETVANMGT